jgi:outer membrane protein OmpA-like peptidoglycan-associated protein
MRRILILALLCSSVFAYGQQAEARLERLRAKSQHATAIQYLKRASLKSAKEWNLAGLIYSESSMPEQAVMAFDAARSANKSEAPFSAEVIFAHVDALRQLGRTEQAIKRMDDYSSAYPAHRRSELWENRGEIEHLELPGGVTMELAKGINSDNDDFAPVFWENRLVFSSSRPQEGFEKTDKRSNDPYIKPWVWDSTKVRLFEMSDKPLTDASPYHVGPISFGENRVFYTKNELQKLDGLFRLQLYSRTRQADSSWGSEEAFPLNNNAFNVGQSAWDSKRQRLYFVSDMPGGLGGTDLYYADWIDSSWAAAQPLRIANTEGKEMFPSIHGDTLFFASNGFPGQGGLDLIMLNLETEEWFLMDDVNSTADDFSPFLDGPGSGWFASNRKAALDGDNIFRFQIDMTALFKEQAKKDSALAAEDAARQASIAVEGEVDYPGLPEKAGQWKKAGGKSLTLTLPPLYYRYNRSDLTTEEQAKLAFVAQTLREQPELHVIVRSHADCKGTEAYNLSLSKQRLGTVERYFANQGITQDQFHGEFHGESEPAMPCEMECSVCPDDIRWANRRTEFIVTNQPRAFAPSLPASSSVVELIPAKEESSVAMVPLVPAQPKAKEVPVKAASTMAQPATAPVSGAVACYLVTGSFKTKALATKRVLELVAQGYPAQSMEVNGMHRVVLPLIERPNDAELGIYRQRLGKVWIARP